MKATMKGRTFGRSGTTTVIRNLKKNAAALPRQTITEFNADAAATAPVLTGRMKSEHKTKKLGPYKYGQIVDVEYGIYVNNGTRHQAAQPWWDQAWAKHQRVFKARFKKAFQ
jgi:hypothetical protein